MPEHSTNATIQMQSKINQWIEMAFACLLQTNGYSLRANQKQLAELIRDGIADQQSMMLEAPTGIGKSLACLIPAIAHGLAGKRVIIATYTNILAEQYLRKDLPFALSLFDSLANSDHDSSDGARKPLKTQFLIGKQRYLCPLSLNETKPEFFPLIKDRLSYGLEADFVSACVSEESGLNQMTEQEAHELWRKVTAPVTCASSSCPLYNDCPYYIARRKALESNLVITNHSVVITDALVKDQPRSSKPEMESDSAESAAPGIEDQAADEEPSDGLLGQFDFLIVDEAHDFPAAAASGLETVIGPKQLEYVLTLANRIEFIAKRSSTAPNTAKWFESAIISFKTTMKDAEKTLDALCLAHPYGGTLFVNPIEWEDFPSLKNNTLFEAREQVHLLTDRMSAACRRFAEECKSLATRLNDGTLSGTNAANRVQDQIKNYVRSIENIGDSCLRLQSPPQGSVTYLGIEFVARNRYAYLHNDVVDIGSVLQDLIWSKVNWACLSATLTVDGQFEYFRDLSGAPQATEEILPSPFDYASKAALYLPPRGTIPDPVNAANSPLSGEYYAALSRDIEMIIRTMKGRTLVLFHSRKEMEAVYERLKLPSSLPILIQGRSSPRTVGKQFLDLPHASLFGVRSFWTGFDAPGETLSCVVLVRIPFEVPTTPTQIARMAMLVSREKNPFTDYALPQAKMLMRQGAGRLIRRDTDWGVVALLDGRIHTKRYGEEIIENLPDGMRQFSSLSRLEEDFLSLMDGY